MAAGHNATAPRQANAGWCAGRLAAVRAPSPVETDRSQLTSIGASTRWVLARRRLAIVAWLLVAVVGLAAGGKGISALSRQSAS
jgi:hypothetical protein